MYKSQGMENLKFRHGFVLCLTPGVFFFLLHFSLISLGAIGAHCRLTFTLNVFSLMYLKISLIK